MSADEGTKQALQPTASGTEPGGAGWVTRLILSISIVSLAGMSLGALVVALPFLLGLIKNSAPITVISGVLILVLCNVVPFPLIALWLTRLLAGTFEGGRLPAGAAEPGRPELGWRQAPGIGAPGEPSAVVIEQTPHGLELIGVERPTGRWPRCESRIAPNNAVRPTADARDVM